MRAFIPDYQLATPPSLAAALSMLSAELGKWKAFAGGTDLMVLLEAGKLPHRNYLNIWQLDELRGIEVNDEVVDLGALTTYTEVQANATLQNEFPMLCRAASETGGLAIQNRGTLGGNIVNGSPAADSPPALLAYDAQIALTSKKGTRWIDYKSFHSGYKEMALQPDELLTRIRLPRSTAKGTHYYRKVGTRRAQAISKICMAAFGLVEDGVIRDLRIAVGSVAPIPLRCFKTEEVLRGQELNNEIGESAREVLIAEITPIDDIRSSAAYRSRVSANLLSDFISTLKAI
jgi:CO/xanthine dehydrogenase FAD-binding subunit